MGRGEKSVKIMKKIAKMNGKQVSFNYSAQTKHPRCLMKCTPPCWLCARNRRKRTNKSEAKVARGRYMWTSRASLGYLDLFRTPDMRRIIIVITILWMLIRCQATRLPFLPLTFFFLLLG